MSLISDPYKNSPHVWSFWSWVLDRVAGPDRSEYHSEVYLVGNYHRLPVPGSNILTRLRIDKGYRCVHINHKMH